MHEVETACFLKIKHHGLMKIKNTRTDEKHFRGDIGHLELIFSLTSVQYYGMMSIQYFIRVQLILRRLVSHVY